MSYQSGTMGIAEGVGLVFIATLARAFLSMPIQAIDQNASLGWVAILLSIAVPLCVVVGLARIMHSTPGDLIHWSEILLGKYAAYVITAYYASGFLVNASILLRQFAENTLITAMPHMDIEIAMLLYIITAAIIVYLGIEPLARAAYVVIPFLLFSIFMVILLLLPFCNGYNLVPWQGKGLDALIKFSLTAAGSNFSSLLLLILAPSFQNYQTIKNAAFFGLGGSALVRATLILAFIAVFGASVGREKVLPFFEMTRLVYISRYLQHVEALFILAWVTCGVLAIATSLSIGLYLITRLLKLPTMQPLIPLVSLILLQAALLPTDILQVLDIDRMILLYLNIGIYLIPLLLIVTARWKERKKPCVTDG